MSVWKDEAHGKTHELDADLSLDSDDENGKTNTGATNPRGGRQLSVNTTSTGPNPLHPPSSNPDSDQEHFSLPPSSRASSQPPTSDIPDDDDFFGPASSSKLNGIPMSGTTKKRIVVDDDEEESFWKELEVAKNLQSSQLQQKSQAAPSRNTDDLDDEEMWAALEAGNQSSIVPNKTGSGSAAKADGMDIDDDDMWDIVRENEQVVPAPAPPAVAEPSKLASEQTSTAVRSLAESEMDWDDMYTN